MSQPEHVETVVVGGGQAGLSVGYHLAQRGLPFVVLDANQRIGDAWRQRWDSLRLFTPARFNGLPGMPFPALGYPRHLVGGVGRDAEHVVEAIVSRTRGDRSAGSLDPTACVAEPSDHLPPSERARGVM